MRATTQGPPMINTNMPFTNIAGMTVPMVDTSQIIQQQLVHQSMIEQHRAFLAHAVQQNLSIQQQLLHQNQALQQLLNSNSPGASGQGNNSMSPAINIQALSSMMNPSGFNLLQTAPLDTSVISSDLNLSSQTTSPFANSFTPNSSKLSETLSPSGSVSASNGHQVRKHFNGLSLEKTQ